MNVIIKNSQIAKINENLIKIDRIKQTILEQNK